ncbi:MAG: serine protease [Candidatus Tectomicrobia bacterium]|uniref:Serine protease n=1 Tax=Tectimicrobiota bacterium TaxID=2528274 RepID=A0A932GR34_UNCTE|nr:serine protease [Candidatus Tectomicrobia bacterium]
MRMAFLPLLIALLIPQAPSTAPKESQLNLNPLQPSIPSSAIERSQAAVVGIKVQVPLDRPSVLTLGPERWGSGVIFDPAGYAVTVSYVVLDAKIIQVSLRDGRVVPAKLVGLDLENGLGVIKLEGDGPWPAAALGDSSKVAVGEATATIGVGEANEIVITQGKIQAIQSFAGYWEYMIDRAFVVAPYNPSFGGSPLFNARAEVIGIVSLRLGERLFVNLAIPIEYFTSSKEELIRQGRVLSRPPRPWLGLYTVPAKEGVVVAGASPIGPASRAGLQIGDLIVRINGEKVESQEEFYRRLWQAQIGQEITLVVLRQSRFQVITLRPVDRYQFFRAPEK